jgi:hypothetical protein
VTPDGAASAASTRDSTWCGELTLFDNMGINVTMGDVVMSHQNHKNNSCAQGKSINISMNIHKDPLISINIHKYP